MMHIASANAFRFLWVPRFLPASGLRVAQITGLAASFAVAMAGVSVDAQTPQEVPPSAPIAIATTASAAPTTLSLQDALQRAQRLNPQYQSAQTDFKSAQQDRIQSRAGLLPSVNLVGGAIFTQSDGTHSGNGRFSASNGVHEYTAQGNLHQNLNIAGGQVADYQRSTAAEALAKAKAEIAARGLTVVVTQSYYGLVVAQRRYANTQAASDEASHFLTITQQLEQGGEVAHADTIKAKLQANDRGRDFRESQLNLEKARLTLAVLLFPDFNENFTVVDDLQLGPPLPTMEEATRLAAVNNLDVRAAVAALDVSAKEVLVARSGLFPTLGFDYNYGLDAPRFETSTNGLRNVGYSAAVSLNLPVWNWWASESKVKQATLRRDQSKLELSAAQRQTLANLRGFYAEADAARAELDSLRDSSEIAAQSLHLTTLRYQAGEANALEVVDAQNTLVTARNAYDDGQARYRLALATLQTLTGSL